MPYGVPSSTATGLGSMSQDDLPEIIYGNPGMQQDASNVNALTNMANRGNPQALALLKEINQANAVQRQASALRQYDQAVRQRDRMDKLADRELAVGLKFLETHANGGTLQQQAQLHQEIQRKYPGSTLPDVSGLTTIVAASQDNRVAIKEAETAEQLYLSTPSPENFAAARRAQSQAYGPDAANKWVDQVNQERAAQRADKFANLSKQLGLIRANSRFEYVPSEGVRTGGFSPGVSILGRGSAEPMPARSFDLDAKNPFEGVEGYEREQARFEQVRERARLQRDLAVKTVYAEAGIKDVDANPQATEQATQAMQRATEAGVPAPAPPVAEAISAEQAKKDFQDGRLPAGRVFMGMDGKRRRYLSNGDVVIVP